MLDIPIDPLVLTISTVPAIPLDGPAMPVPLVPILPAPVVLDVEIKKNVPEELALELEIVKPPVKFDASET